VEIEELKIVAPSVVVVNGLSREEAVARAEKADGAEGVCVTPEFLSRAKNLVWIQAMSAGVDRFKGVTELVDNDRIVLTIMRGVHGPAVDDHAFAMLLALTRDLRFHAMRRGDTPGAEIVERVGSPDDLLAMLPEAGVVAVCVPLTEETRGLFGKTAFAAMKPGAIPITRWREGWGGLAPRTRPKLRWV
jgi:phosphoglycerate dehydrogenase-like enzyme